MAPRRDPGAKLEVVTYADILEECLTKVDRCMAEADGGPKGRHLALRVVIRMRKVAEMQKFLLHWKERKKVQWVVV